MWITQTTVQGPLTLVFRRDCEVTTFQQEELLATKVRALYQRRKGRDLFDLWLGLTAGKADAAKVEDFSGIHES